MDAFVVFLVAGAGLLWWTTATESGRRFAADPVAHEAPESHERHPAGRRP